MLPGLHRRAQRTDVAIEVDVPAGSRLCMEGVCVRQLVTIVEGSAETTVEGRHTGTVVAGACIGWPEVLSGAPAPCTVTATTPAVVIISTRAECFALRDTPQLVRAPRDIRPPASLRAALTVGSPEADTAGEQGDIGVTAALMGGRRGG